MEGTNTEELGRHETIIEVEDVSRDFVVGVNTIAALKNINLKVQATDFVVIFGPSGCGKSTLLNLILGIDKPTKGIVTIRDKKIFDFDEDERALFRAKKIGMVYQMPYWIKSLNVLENVALPLIIDGINEKDASQRAGRILQELEIHQLANQRPTQLSGGQQQKVGVARALISNPWILMADEPTGNLDSRSGDEIMNIFKDLNQNHKRTIMLVTHNQNYWHFGTRRLEMKDGEIIKDTRT